MPKKIIYVTNAYPGDLYSEKAFVDPELSALRKHFDEILLLPTDFVGRSMGYDRMLPDGVSVDWSLAKDRTIHSKLRKSVYAFHPFVIRALVGMIGEARTPRQWIKGLFQAINIVRAGKIVKKVAKTHGMTPDDTLLFSMWFHDAAGALARLALRDGWKMASHAHTSDIYDERMIFRSRRLRARLLRGASCILTISRRGCDYLRNRFPDSADRIIHHPLGSLRLLPDNPAAQCPVSTAGQSPVSTAATASAAADKPITFAIVARLDPIKCIDLIIETLNLTALALPGRRMEFTVIGDGECLPALQEQSGRLKSKNLRINFTGALDNKEIQRRFALNPPDWYIMMSRSEGLPVSMGEAMSHAIPVITTDVGEIAELVTPACALLLPPGRPAEDYAKLILPVITDPARRDEMALASLARWEEFFDASRLAAETASLLAEKMEQKV